MASKTKKFKVDPLSKANSDINVTPLVDVVLVLLIIFMVVTPLMEKDIQVRIPEQEQTPPPPTDEPPPPQIVLAIKESGEYLLNNEPVPAEMLTERLKRALAAKKYEDKIVFFMPEEKSNYGLLIAALDMARAADKKATLGMVTQDIPAAPGAPTDGSAPPPPTTP